jgi:hypothetical protein
VQLVFRWRRFCRGRSPILPLLCKAKLRPTNHRCQMLPEPTRLPLRRAHRHQTSHIPNRPNASSDSYPTSARWVQTLFCCRKPPCLNFVDSEGSPNGGITWGVVNIYKRRGADCDHKEDRNYKRWGCAVWLGYTRDGKQVQKSAKTKSGVDIRTVSKSARVQVAASHRAILCEVESRTARQDERYELQVAATEDGGIVWHPRKPKSIES